MASDWYVASGWPAASSPGTSAPARTEFAAIQTAMAKLPAITGATLGAAVVINGSGTGLTTTVGALALAGNLVTTGAFNTTFAQQQSSTLTLPNTASDTLVARNTADTLTNKTLTGPAISGVTALGVRDTSAAFDVSIGCTSSVTLTAARALTIDVANGSRTLKLTTNATLNQDVSTAGSPSVQALHIATASGNSVLDMSPNGSGVIGSITAKADGTVIIASSTGLVQFNTLGGTSLTLENGAQVGTPTGGDKGVGTINAATNIYLNGTAYTNPDYVLEKWATGEIVRFANADGAAHYNGLRPLSEVEASMRETFALPRLAEARARAAKYGNSTGLGDGGDALLASLEEAYLYIFQLNREIERLKNIIR